MTDVHQLITEHLEIWTSATEKKSGAGRGNGGTVSLYGIQKLRELILELAVRGKLVSQVSSEGTATSELSDLAQRRKNLVRSGLAKKTKSLPQVSRSETPFGLPENWAWARLQDVSEYVQRGKSPMYSDDGSTMVVSQKCVQWAGFEQEKARFIADDSLSSYGRERFLRAGDVLWNSTGTGTVGRVVALNTIGDTPLVADSHVTVIRSLTDCPKFIEVYLSSSGIQRRIDPAHENSLVSGTTKQVELNLSSVLALPIPIPPAAEQHRIVAKVDELMRLCDALERQAEDSLKAHQTLVEVCLSALTNSQTPDEHADNWSRLGSNFETLFTTEESVELLRKTILQWAVMGRLCPHASNGQTGTQIVKDVAKARAALISRGEIRREKPVSPLDPRSVPHHLPDRWVWAKVGEIALFTQYGTSEKARARSDGIPVLAMGNIQRGEVTLESEKFMPRSWGEFPELFLKPGDLLYNRTNSAELVGKTGLYEGPEDSYTFASYLIRIRLDHNLVRPKYLNFVMNSPYFRETQVVPHIKKQTGQANVNGTILKNMLVPVPPLREQDDIIDRIENLNRTCDGLAGLIREQDARQRTIAYCLTSQIH